MIVLLLLRLAAEKLRRAHQNIKITKNSDPPRRLETDIHGYTNDRSKTNRNFYWVLSFHVLLHIPKRGDVSSYSVVVNVCYGIVLSMTGPSFGSGTFCVRWVVGVSRQALTLKKDENGPRCKVIPAFQKHGTILYRTGAHTHTRPEIPRLTRKFVGSSCAKFCANSCAKSGGEK